MNVGEFLRARRQKCGYYSYASLSQLAERGGVHISAEAIRKYECGSIPTKKARAALTKILDLDAEQQRELAYLCARADLSKRYKDLELVMICPYTRDFLAEDISRGVDYMGLEPELGEKLKEIILERAKRLLTPPKV